MVELQHLSHSSISAYLSCGRYWRFKYVDRIPGVGSPALAFGSAVHATISRVVLAQHEAPLSALGLTSIWTEEWGKASAGNIAWDGDIPESMANDGIRLFGAAPVQEMLSSLSPLVDPLGPVIDRRVELHVPGVPIPVIGFVDFIGADLVPTDFKTASRAWTQNQAEQESQPLIYLAALNQLQQPHASGRFRHRVLVKTKTTQVQCLDSTHTMAEMFWAFEMVREVWRGIEAGIFAPNPKACFAWGRPCEFWAMCRGKG